MKFMEKNWGLNRYLDAQQRLRLHHRYIYYVTGVETDHVRTLTLYVLLPAVNVAPVCSNGIAKEKDFSAN